MGDTSDINTDSLAQSLAATSLIQCPDVCKCINTNSLLPTTGAPVSLDCSGLGVRHVVVNHEAMSNDSSIVVDGNVTSHIQNNQVQQDWLNKTLVIRVQSVKLADDIVSLDLSNNQLQHLTREMFQDFQSLVYLNLSNNNISLIENTTFTDLIYLEILDLSFNNINTFPWDSLNGLGKLSQLILNNNNIHLEVNSTDMSPYLRPVTMLDIANNPITELPSNFFHPFPFLRSLNVANCSIQEIDQTVFDNMKHLEKLNLSNNNIKFISQPLFQETSLKWLSISDMPNLTTLSHEAFHGLSGLEYLNLSRNPKIHWIQPNLLTPLNALKILDLSNSGIQFLSGITFLNNKHLQEIFVNDNPFQCSCVNAWLAKETLMANSKFVNVSSLQCNSENSGQKYLSDADFRCKEITVQNMTSRVFVPLGTRMLLECKYESEDAAVIKWTTPSGEAFYHHHFYSNASQHLLSPKQVQPDSDFHSGHYWHDTTSYHSELSTQQDRIMILSDGSLYIDYMTRSDPGPYICQVSNEFYNHTSSISIYLTVKLSGEVKIYSIIAGLICAAGFFTLNLIYVIISWTARHLVNKRRREIIRQMLENLNAYKTTQISRIHVNYTHQLTRVRNQYHIQRDRLHRNYTSQVTRVKRGCSNQVEKVRDNYNSKLHQLRDYSSNQIIQIRERANNQIVRIRDYGSNQLDKLRETYKLQQQHVLKLLDTMNLDNCRHVVETECMRAESMMYDIDLLGDDARTDSPLSQMESEYTTAASSPATSLEEASESGLRSKMAADDNRDYSTSSSEMGIIIEMQTRIDVEPAMRVNVTDTWPYDHDSEENHQYSMRVQCQSDPENKCLLEIKSETDVLSQLENDLKSKLSSNDSDSNKFRSHHTDIENQYEGSYVTAESSPVKLCPSSQFPIYKMTDLSEKESLNNLSPKDLKENSETNV
ncbi:hypothetical protein Btru_044856 [Bulinus truncatus]|nr:hypothetical protein Btru_044856 [Bulinus truncatus]